LCMAQRVVFMALGTVLLIAGIHNPQVTGRRMYGFLTALTALAGAALAGRQLWLQSLPADQVPACGPSLEYMLDVFPLAEVLMIMIQGTGDCAKVDWTFLGLSIAGWTFVWFAGFVLLAIFQLVRPADSGER
jgi:protein dithiol:quinone oxidoreductase